MPRNDLIQLRSDTAANWASVNPTLAVGETGFETDTGKLKVGTGSSDWNSLIYVTDASDLAGIIPSARISGSYTGITGVGTLTAGTWNASAIAGQYGGTGVANTGKTITLGGNLTTSGAFTTTLTVGANTSLTLPSSGTVISTVNLSSITSVGTLTGLTIGGAGSNRFITINAPTGYYAIQYFAINGTNEWHYEVNPAGDRWSLVETGVAERIGVTSTGATFSGTVTATTFSGSLASSNLTGQTGMWTSAGRPGATRLYRNDFDDAYNVQTYWTGARWRLRGYFNNTFHAESEVGYADSAGYASSSGIASGVSSGGGGIPYPGATIGGGAPNGIGFRWASPVVNCTVDNVISAEAANFSDRRLKTNINVYNGGLNAVRVLRPVTFNPLDITSFTEDGEPIVGDKDPYDEMLGFIADEVQEVIPSAISGTGNQLKSVSVLQILSVAVSAIKELDATVQSLTERIKQLEESNV